MNKTYMAKKADIQRSWYIVDAQNKILGRVASKVAAILKGKHKPIYTPHLDTGDGVIVINAAGIKVSGRKATQKVYQRYSGYQGGQKTVPYATMLAKRPTTVMKLAVSRMLPQGPLGRDMIKKLKVYADAKHPHQTQKAIPLEIK